MSKADSMLSALHTLTAERLISELSKPEVDPRFVTAAVKFLKDNGISGEPLKGTPLGVLSEQLPFDELRRQ